MKTFKHMFELADLGLLGDMVEGGDLPPRLIAELENHPSWTWTDSKGVVLLCGGYVPVWAGLAESWAMVSRELADSLDKKAILQSVYESHQQISIALRYRRIQADVRTGWRQGAALVKFLGYYKECDMTDYGPRGETTSKWVWLAKEHGICLSAQ